jgi:hypothetical protein
MGSAATGAAGGMSITLSAVTGRRRERRQAPRPQTTPRIATAMMPAFPPMPAAAGA